jgi:ABC-type multidrug transport system fused ATPase/permease subunit
MARDADQVVVMDNGEVVDRGTHDELIVQPQNLYREIYGKQYGEDRLPPEKREEKK